MLTQNANEVWNQFLDFVRDNCSATAYENWIAPITFVESKDNEIVLQVPNIFVQEYLLSNFSKELKAFLPLKANGEPAIQFQIKDPGKVLFKSPKPQPSHQPQAPAEPSLEDIFQSRFNPGYTFDTFIEGPSNQFVKSAAMGVASRPGKSYNPLFIHGGVGLGKTHLLHSIGNYIAKHHKGLKVQCITTEAFINDLVDSLRNKAVEKMKRFYRNLDILIVDDIQFLQNRLNFEDEFCNTFEALINQNKQIVIASDKPPAQLKLSERIVARMEWGLVAHLDVPDLETRVAILQFKAERKGFQISNEVAFFIAEHVYSNIRQLEGAVNRLSAHCRLLNRDLTRDLVERALNDMLQQAPTEKISVEQILKSVSSVFNVRVTDLKGTSRAKEIALPRQVAMYLAKEMINESLIMLGASFGKTHSTLLHAYKNITNRLKTDDLLQRQINMVKRHIQP